MTGWNRRYVFKSGPAGPPAYITGAGSMPVGVYLPAGFDNGALSVPAPGIAGLCAFYCSTGCRTAGSINFLSGLAIGIAVRAAGITGRSATYRPADNPLTGWTRLPAGDPARRDSKAFFTTRTAGLPDPAGHD